MFLLTTINHRKLFGGYFVLTGLWQVHILSGGFFQCGLYVEGGLRRCFCPKGLCLNGVIFSAVMSRGCFVRGLSRGCYVQNGLRRNTKNEFVCWFPNGYPCTGIPVQLDVESNNLLYIATWCWILGFPGKQ